MRVLILEDDLRDLRIAVDVAQAIGFADIDAFMWLAPAQACFAEALRGETPLPDAVILDLCVGCDSGYELLRTWHASHAKSKMRMIVWSRMEARNEEICDLFGIDAYVSKYSGPSALREALRPIEPEIFQ